MYIDFQGMRIAFQESEFIDQLHAAKSESRKSFNDEAVLLEKFIERPRYFSPVRLSDKINFCFDYFNLKTRRSSSFW